MIEFCILISAICHFIGFLILETRIKSLQDRLDSKSKSLWRIESVGSDNPETTYTVHYFKPDDESPGAVAK